MREISIPLLSLKPNSRASCIAGVTVLLLAGGIITFFSARSYVKGKDASHWQPVAGNLIDLAWHTPSEGPDYPTAQYRYVFKGKSYHSGNLVFGAASEICARLRSAAPGEKIIVFVNPANPSESVLFPGASGFAKTFLAVGIGLTTTGVGVGLTCLACSTRRTMGLQSFNKSRGHL